MVITRLLLRFRHHIRRAGLWIPLGYYFSLMFPVLAVEPKALANFTI